MELRGGSEAKSGGKLAVQCTLNSISRVWDNSTVTAVQCVEHTINGRWAGSRPGFRFDSGCSASPEGRKTETKNTWLALLAGCFCVERRIVYGK